jgi:hypothetical protein
MSNLTEDPMTANVSAARGRSHLTRFAVAIGAIALTFGLGAAAAFAVSGGGNQPSQQDCQSGDNDYATPSGVVYPGCHNFALNVESGGNSQGVANSNNTRYVEYGDNQVPNDPHSVGTPGEFSIGEPGYTDDPHSGCIAVNTDGTGGGAAPPKTKPESPGKAAGSKYGCGNNAKGFGFEGNYDYYQYYCPIAAMLSHPCEDTNPGTNSFSPDTGNQVNYQPIVDNGLIVYLGADDNLDNGEHDGVGPYSTKTQPYNNGAENGPSDGGAITLLLTPRGVTDVPSQTNPEGLANMSFGACADGICVEFTTEQQTVYHGCNAPDSNGEAPCDSGTPQSANVYDYAPGGKTANDPSVNSESPNCNSGDVTTTNNQACGSGGMNAIRSATPANENAEPGFQLYSDPDPQRSPAAPSPVWPTPGVYVGTCGVYVGSPATTGAVVGANPMLVGGMPVTNRAGQIAIDPNPSAC